MARTVSAIAFVLLGACAHDPPPLVTEPIALQGLEGDTRAPRQPEAVFLDIPLTRPEARTVVPAHGVVTLALPLTREEADTLVRAYFHAFAPGDGPGFAPLLARDARRVDDRSPSDLAASLEGRLRAIDYAHAPLDAVAAYDEIRIVSYEAAPEKLRIADGMREGDVLVEVPMRLQRVGIVRLFGARVVLVVRRDGKGTSWKIAGVREDDGPWS
jgi:hypothetical protein